LLTTAPPTSAALRYTSRQLTADFDILEGALLSGDPGIFRFKSRYSVYTEFRDQRARLDRPMDAMEFYGVLAPTVAAIEDGHTHLDWPAGLKERLLAHEPLFPFGVRVLDDDRVYIFRDFSSNSHDLAGFELLSINGRAANSIVKEISAMLSEDGDISSSRRIDSSGVHFLEGLYLVAGVKGPFLIRLRKNALVKTLTIAGKPESSVLQTWKKLYGGDFEVRHVSAADFRLLPGSSAVMRVSDWDDSNPDGSDSLRKKFATWFAMLQSSKTKTLIIDIRHNGGGEETLGTLLFSYLADGTFPYYRAALANGTDFGFFKYVDGTAEKDALPLYVAPTSIDLEEERGLPGAPTARYELVNRPNLGVQQPSSPHFAGRVFILIDGQSFSTSAEFAAIAHSSGRATLIGEETSGSYYGDDSGITPTVVLPDTKFRIDVPLIAYYMAVEGHRYAERGVLPDCPVKYTIADDLANRDLAMDVALRLASDRRVAQCSRIEY
jgi:hypothetical protein